MDDPLPEIEGMLKVDLAKVLEVPLEESYNTLPPGAVIKRRGLFVPLSTREDGASVTNWFNVATVVVYVDDANKPSIMASQ